MMELAQVNRLTVCEIGGF